jgi:hypothetical protein
MGETNIMTVQELIDYLNKIEDKDTKVVLSNIIDDRVEETCNLELKDLFVVTVKSSRPRSIRSPIKTPKISFFSRLIIQVNSVTRLVE